MIYLIGGSPRCGKTTVAARLAKQTGVSWFPADYIGAAIFQYLSPEQQRAMFPLSRIRDEKPGTDYLYAKHRPEEVVEFYRTQAEALWPGLRAFIKYAASDKQTFILEGYQIWPDLLNELPADIKSSIRPIFLYKTDAALIEAGFKKSADPNDWLLRTTEKEDTFSKIASMVVFYGEETTRLAKQHDMPVFSMDGDFHEKVQEVTDILTSS